MTKNELLDLTKEAGAATEQSRLDPFFRYESVAQALVGETNHHRIMLVLQQAHRNGMREAAVMLLEKANTIQVNMNMLDELAKDI